MVDDLGVILISFFSSAAGDGADGGAAFPRVVSKKNALSRVV